MRYIWVVTSQRQGMARIPNSVKSAMVADDLPFGSIHPLFSIMHVTICFGEAFIEGVQCHDT